MLFEATLAISAVLRNLGQTAVPSATARVWAGEPEIGELVVEEVVAIGAQSSLVLNTTHLLVIPGTAIFTVELDPDDVVTEADEANNLASVSVSTEEVASSRMRIQGSFKSVRAMAILCFCPPERVTPLSPTRVL